MVLNNMQQLAQGLTKMQTITDLWTRMRTGQKRKAPVDDELDFEKIVYERDPPSQPPARKRRRVLEELKPTRAHGQRTRSLKYVLIPKPHQESQLETKARSSASHKSSSTKALQSRKLTAASIPASRSPAETPEIETAVKSDPKRTPASKASTKTELVVPTSPSPPDEISKSQISNTKPGSRAASFGRLDDPLKPGRSRRSAGRPSYAVFLDDDEDSDDGDSEDHLSINPRRRRKRVNDESSDFEVGQDEGEDESDDSVVGLESDGSSATSVSEDISDVEDFGIRKSKKAPVTKSPYFVKPATKSRPTGKMTTSRMVKLLTAAKGEKGLDMTLPPLFEINDIFEDMTTKAVDVGLEKALKHFGDRPLRVATMCSGTESPILALQMIRDALSTKSIGELELNHLFSAEIVPYKQAYIERNFNPPIIFRDITELTDAVKEDTPMATTAYGAEVPVPTDIDLVIAGTSCVDFSKLNNFQKGLTDGGESDKTWHAVLAFCNAFRPAIVLLENVFNAHWDQMLQDYEEIGYEAAGVHVDTKNYYIPQTRQRGYMVCVEKHRFVGADSAVSKWQDLMKSFRRPASSPASSFLLPNDQVVIRDQSRGDESRREVDWSRCEITQMQYRQDKRIGNARPFTNWQESGAMLIPENGSKAWYSWQVERVLDTIDAAILRKALPKNGGYDCRYKTRIWNLSQNIYRDEDNSPFGMIGCITPTGQYFASDAGRAMTPEEVLKLQGLPLDRISFTTESPAEIQDLAGNAMSAPVVGSAILAALIAGYKAIHPSQQAREHIQGRQQPKKQLLSLSGQQSSKCFNSDGGDLDLKTLIDNCRRSMRRCYCEQGNTIAVKPLQQCSDCSHTTCTSCGGNPLHNYRQHLDLTKDRIMPGDFESSLRSNLPLRLRLCSVEGLQSFANSAGNKSKDHQRYYDVVAEAIDDVFYLSHFRRTYCLTITYNSSRARLELVFDDARLEWRLYVHPGKHLPSDSWLRRTLSKPVARSIVTQSLFKSEWQLCVPDSTAIKTTVRGHGQKMPTWWARNEMPDFVDHWQWEFLDIEGSFKDLHLDISVGGTYRYLPRCGTANDSLYKKIGTQGQNVFLFHDPTRTGAPAKDRFVFCTNKALLEYDETRQIIASFEPSWKPWEQRKAEASAQLSTDGFWQPVPDMSFSKLSTDMEISKPFDLAFTDGLFDCKRAVSIVSCAIPQQTDHEEGNTSRIIDVNEGAFFSQYAWAFEAMRRHLTNEWYRFPVEVETKCCTECAPSKPSLRWRLAGDGDITPYEDPAGAAAYERAMKNRLQPVLIEMSGLKIQIGVNLASLAHRARKRLEVSEDINFDWRITTNSAENASFSFPAFQLVNTKNVRPYEGKVLTVDMFPKQLLALAWMRQQEAGEGQRFVLEESEEAPLPKLGWRVEMRAQAPVFVRGGVCADHPGFGKTITTLALIESQFKDKSASDIVRQELEPRLDGAGNDLIPIAATLIVCPLVLIDQWKSEIEDKLDYKRGVVIIRVTGDLAKFTIEAFTTAKIIIVSRNVLGADPYAERLAAFAGVPGPATNRARSFGEWLKYAASQVPDHLRILKESGRTKLQQHVRDVYGTRMKSDEFKAAIPSRRLRGKDYVASGAKKDTTKQAAVGKLDTSSVGTPLFEMFYFNRMVVDEFHQYLPREYTAITALKADKRWALSATPALGDFYDIAQMAGLLSIRLPIGSDARGIMKMKNVREMRRELTDFERFDSMRTVPSSAIHSRIHELDQRFLNVFVRRNIMDFGGMQYADHMVPVHLDLDHRALYTELSQHLNSLDMRIRKGSKSKNTSREERLTKILDDAESAEEALSRTVVFDPECTGAFSQQAGLTTLVNVREDEHTDIKRRLNPAMAAAENREAAALQAWRGTRLKDKTIGDSEVIEVLQNMSTQGSKATKPTKRDGDRDSNTASTGGKHAKTSEVNTLAERLLVSTRSLRFAKTVQLVQQAASGGAEIPTRCNKVDCGLIDACSDMAVSALCGHTICRKCFIHMEQVHATKCPAEGCSASMRNHHLLWLDKMGDLRATSHTQFGAKIDAAMDLLDKIKKQSDQAILFVQYERQLEQVKRALEKRDVSAFVVDETNRAGDKIKEFRTSAGSANQKTVIVLNASDETAAGSNLQNANHVIFLSPLLRDTQYGYDSTMAQAIGRVRRHGQRKSIHVYRITALDTIDVDILEHRERRTSALTELNAPEIEPPAQRGKINAEGELTPERTQLVCENGHFSLRPQSWLVGAGSCEDAEGMEKVKGKTRVAGWEDFSSLVKFSLAYTEDDD